MQVICSSVVVFGLFLVPALAQVNTPDKPEVLILTTGGTIASPTDAPQIDGHTLVRAVPQLADHASLDVEEFSRVGSSKLTPTHWLGLANRINSAFADNPDLTAVVITHGTDTMEETAFFLHLTVRSDKPVVLVGSMRSADEISADGPANLLNAIRVSVSEAAIGKGVMVVLNEDISSARDVWKTDNRRVHTFRSSSTGFLGTVDPDGVRFYQESLRPHTSRTEFDVSSLKELPRVAILSDFTGIDSVLVTEFATLKMDGLVIRTFAGGRMSDGMLAGLRETADAGPPIVITSRVPGGRIVSAPNYDFPAIVASDLPDNKARILLMLALTRTHDRIGIQRIFDIY